MEYGWHSVMNTTWFFTWLLLAVLLANRCKVNPSEWLITLISSAWLAELFNTEIEKLADRVTRGHDTLIGQVKDLASGAVLIMCFFAVICAVIIYLPYILALV
jgi:diacylglycerol kinase